MVRIASIFEQKVNGEGQDWPFYNGGQRKGEKSKRRHRMGKGKRERVDTSGGQKKNERLRKRGKRGTTGGKEKVGWGGKSWSLY